MRFHRVRVEAFGAIAGLDTGPAGLPPFVVVAGRNEAGKTTFFELLVAILYGFYPASRDTNPWAPWDGTTAAAGAWLRLDDGTCWEVHRRLLSSPTGSLVRGSEEEALRNQTLPCVGHVPRRVFRQVYALTLQELASLDADGWAAVQDRIVGGLGARDLRSSRRVVEELESEAGALWRPNRRGRQAVRDIGERIRALGYRRSEAREAERTVRSTRAELERATARLDELRVERRVARERLDHARETAPALRRLERVRELEKVAGPDAELEGLPADPAGRVEELRRALDDNAVRLASLEAARGAPERAVERCGDRQRALLARESEIDALATRFAVAEPDRVRTGQIEQEVRDLKRRLEGTLDAVPADAPPDPDALARVRPADLRHALQKLRRAEDELRMPAPLRGTSPSAFLAGGTLVLAGALLAVVGLLAERPLLTWIGVILLAGVAVAAGLTSGSARRRERERLAGAEARSGAARTEAAALLAPLNVSPDAALSAPELPATVERARDLVRDLAERTTALERAHARTAELDDAMAALRRDLPLESALPADPALAVHVLRTAAREAARQSEAASAAERELGRIAEDEQRARDQRDRLTRELAGLEEHLRRLGAGDLERGGEIARRRLEARRRGRDLRGEMAPGEEEALAAGAPAGEAELTALAARERELVAAVEEGAAKVQELRSRLEHLAKRETLDDLDGEVRALEDERLRLVRRRDRLHLLARVLGDADRWIREEHQPEVLRRAGEHLATLTGGRYDRLLVDAEDGRSFLVRGPEVPAGVPVARPLSTGTREQVYLALRLALLDALDGGRETLPLVLDEVLVNWDPERRGRGLDLLAGFSKRRQVLLFTCHPDLARAAEERGAGRIDLGGS